MQSKSSLDRFLDKVDASLREETLVRLVLSSSRSGNKDKDTGQRVTIRLIELQSELCFQVTRQVGNQSQVENGRAAELVGWIRRQVPDPFTNALLGTTKKDWQLTLLDQGEWRLVSHPPAQRTVPPRSHDRSKATALDSSARDWLEGLDILDAQGKPRASMSDKYRQICRFVEILDHHLGPRFERSSAPSESQLQPLRIADMGCGKGYLTFAVWHWLHRVRRRPVQILGYESRPSLVADCNALAKRVGAEGLEFVAGSIESTEWQPGSLDALIALHACNTATDHAIAKGIQAGAQAILVAPCCHQALRPEIVDPKVLSPVLQHGLFKERLAEWLTDGLRALYLEQAGYRVKAIEFVSSEHTGKNLMLCAVRDTDAPTSFQRTDAIASLKAFFGLSQFPLDSVMGSPRS